MTNIRNFSIIAHIDHGKSTLSDRMLELTATIEKRKMKEQVLDVMDLERERGITIKMQPVRMEYTQGDERYIFNLIDTPGHIDFSYEVSRSLKAVEGAILLVDATQGVQAQTLTTLRMAQELGLVIVPVITKIDSSLARIDEVKEEIAELLLCEKTGILSVSGKTGEGVPHLFDVIVARIPPPKEYEESAPRGLVFDFEYDAHRGIIIYTRLFSGIIQKGDAMKFVVTGNTFTVLECGIFKPQQEKRDTLSYGEIGYVVTGIKDAENAVVGDTIVSGKKPLPALSGYHYPQSVVWASVYPEGQDEFIELRYALQKLKLSDASLSFEEESSTALGRGFRCGFLGMLHLEIVIERLKREHMLTLVVTAPSVAYEVVERSGKKRDIYTPSQFPDHGNYEKAYEPWVLLDIITKSETMGDVMRLIHTHEGSLGESQSLPDGRIRFEASLPLRELMRGFFDEVKSVSSGYASFSYVITGMREASVTRLDILVGGEIVGAFSQVVSLVRVEEEAKALVERLYKILPRQLFVVKIQAEALGRIISSKTLSALKKDVTAKLYGGDITRKMKLREKQKKGKKKMRERGSVNIPHDVFLKMLRQGE
ncbi:MAG: translation elongation factor 4 [Candidatus Paceibacterota bacterium]